MLFKYPVFITNVCEVGSIYLRSRQKEHLVAKVIAMFNNKGGVSKTTTTFNLGWMLAERGHTVVMVDADPQCNLTGMVLDLATQGSLDSFYENNPKRNIRDALEPAFSSRPRPIEALDCVPIEGRDNLFLIPGHVGLAEDEVSLGVAQQLSETLQPLKNLPGSFRYLFDVTAESYDADFVLVDLSPGLGAINQNLVATADYFIMPASPDVFSLMAIESLSRVLPRWKKWADGASNLEALSKADYPFPRPKLKFLGTIIQRYRLRSGSPTEGFTEFFDSLDKAIEDLFVPALESVDLMLPEESYAEADLEGAYRLAGIPDFNSLITDSQKMRKPVFALEKADTGKQGFVWDQQKKSIESFREIFSALAVRVEKLTDWEELHESQIQACDRGD